MVADAINTGPAEQGAAEPILPGDAAKNHPDAQKAEGQPQSAAPQGNQPGAHAEGKKENAPTEGDALVDAAMTGSGAPREAQAQDAAGNPVEKLTAERELHDLEEGVHPDGRGREPKSYPEPKTVGHLVNQDNVSEPGVQKTTHVESGEESVHHTGEDAPLVDDEEKETALEREPVPGE